jgi:hypothetical protein
VIAALLVLIAVIMFVLRAFGVGGGGTVDLGWLGLAFYAAAALVGYLPAARVTRNVP